MILKALRILGLFSLMIVLSVSLKAQHATTYHTANATSSEPVTFSGSCNNLDFTDSTTGWVGRWCDTPNQTNYTTPANALPVVGLNASGRNLFGYVHELVTPGMDPHVPISRVPPGHASAIRLGDDKPFSGGGGPQNNPFNHQTISNTFTVSAANPTITYWYAVVFDQDLQKPHDSTDQPYFKIRLFDEAQNEILCASYDVNATSASDPTNGFQTVALDNKVEAIYKDWVPIFIPLINYVNQKMTIQFESSDCSKSGHFGYAYIAVDCDPYEVITSKPYICGSDTMTLRAPQGAATYKWTGPGVIQPDNKQIININAAGHYQVTMQVYGNRDTCTFYLDTIVPGNNNNVKALFSNTTVCVGNPTKFTDESTSTGNITKWSWDFNNDGVEDSNLQNPSYTFPSAGTFAVKLTIKQSTCDAIVIKDVIVNPLPVLLITDPPPLCKPSIIDITAPAVTAGSTSGGIFSYWLDSTALAPLSNPSSITTAGTYYIKLTSPQGCVSTKPVTVSFNTAPVLVITNPAAVCAPATVDITNSSITSGAGGGTLTYWTDANATIPVSNPTAVSTGTYYVKSTPLTGCAAIASIVVTVNPFPTVNAGSAVNVCPGVSVQLNGAIGGSATSATWGGGAGTFSNKNSLTTAYTPTPAEYTAGSVTLTLTTDDPPGPCGPASSDVTLTFYKNPVIKFAADKKKACPVLCSNFIDSSIVAGGTVTAWEWNFGDTGSAANTSNLPNPSHCFENTGFYDISLKVTSNQGCVSSLTIPKMIQVFAVPVAEFIPTPNPATMEDPRVTLKNASSKDVVYWNYHFGDGDSVSPAVKSPLHKYPGAFSGSYLATLLVRNANGCVSYVEHWIEISPEFSFYIPNAFTPIRADGNNDTFFGKGVGIVNYHLWVFDRWGNMVFNTADINTGWDGRANNGKDVAQEDVFVWKVKLTDVFGVVHDYIGTVTIVK